MKTILRASAICLLFAGFAMALTGERMAEIPLDKMSSAQRAVADAIMSGPRQGLRGPFNSWLRSPVLADRLQKVGEYIRFNTSLDKRVNEMAIIMTAQAWGSQYEWYAHAPLAIKAGLDPSIVAAIGAGRKPENMKDDEDSRPDPKQPPPMAGYTYLGQFINHDLTLDLTPLDRAQPNVTLMPNFRTPFLDLDHVYGGGPNVSPFLYDRQSKHGEERFLIGDTTPSSVGGRNFPSTQDDLPRNSQGIALIGDPRQDENLIIAQLHVAFLKLHNRVLDGLKRGEIKNACATLFEQARRIVTWHYQWVVRHDFLREILDPKVFEQTFTDERYARKDEDDFQIPVEYSLAAGRFGLF